MCCLPFCSSIVLDRTLLEQIGSPLLWKERHMDWLKDAAAGVGLMFFVASSFALASAAQAIFAG